MNGVLGFGLRLASGRLVLNARAETVLEKPLFRRLVLAGRVVVPAQCFYEWDRNRVRHAFSRFDGRDLMLAGIGDGHSFAILTTAANASMSSVHSRMPLVLEKDQICSWLEETGQARKYLRMTPPQLHREAADGQMGLW